MTMVAANENARILNDPRLFVFKLTSRFFPLFTSLVAANENARILNHPRLFVFKLASRFFSVVYIFVLVFC